MMSCMRSVSEAVGRPATASGQLLAPHRQTQEKGGGDAESNSQYQTNDTTRLPHCVQGMARREHV